jgi:hypothetical protein
MISIWESVFQQLSLRLIDSLQAHHESLSLELVGEDSQFIRFNRARVRQTGVVMDCSVKLTLRANQRSAYMDFPLTGDLDTDLTMGQESLSYLRQELPQLPEDPFLIFPENKKIIHTVLTHLSH